MKTEYLKKYKEKTKNSAKLFRKSLQYHVNGVSHNIRFFEPYPFVVKTAYKKFLTDVDNNKYIDFWMGHWSLILGHKPTNVAKSLQKQLKKDWMYGTVNEQSIQLSEKISKYVPVAEKIRYVTSGTEATMYAVRLARAITSKKIIVKIDGGWHGYTSDLLKTVNWPFNESESNGILNERMIVSIPYNDVSESLRILNKNSKNIAAIIVEPVLGGGGCIPATKDYLRALQEFTRKNNSLFIIDEIVTGFRFYLGCMYKKLKLDPDIVTLGKIVGGGLPIGVICGKKELMNFANTKYKKKKERAYIGGGTFSANPLSMTAGNAMLSELKHQKSIYHKINHLGEKTRRRLKKIFGNTAIVTGTGSLFMTHFVTKEISKVTNAMEASKCNTDLLYQYHFKMIANDNIFFLPGKLGAFSKAHDTNDVRKILLASEEFINENNIK